MATPSAIFPAAVATDAQLKVGNNLIQTSLLVAVNTANTILFVNSTAGFVANCLISVDKEIMAVASVVAAPNPQLIVAPGGRGFDGTTAASHSPGAKISMLIVAWHHNALSTEIQAIEAALGPNLQKVGQPIDLVTTSFAFAPQTPGGVLNPGSNVITLAPVPSGVNGTNTSANHYLWISGGTGTAEAVRITGGTAVSGAASGTVIVTCANAHSGAWTIQSATAGLQEAYYSNGGSGGVRIRFPAGNITLYAPATIATNNLAIVGAGSSVTNLFNSQLNSGIFILNNGVQGVTIQGLTMIGNTSSTSGYAIQSIHNSAITMSQLSLVNWPSAILLDTLVLSVLRDVAIREIYGGCGVVITGPFTNQILLDDVSTTSSVAHQAGCNIQAGGNQVFTNCQFSGGGGGTTKGDVWINPVGVDVFSTDLINTYLDQGARGLYINPGAGGRVLRTRLTHVWASGAGNNGIHLAAGGAIHEVTITNCEVSLNSANGIEIDDGNTININGSTFGQNGQSAIALDAGNYVAITGNLIGNDLAGWQIGSSLSTQYGVYHPGVATNVAITGNVFSALALQSVFAPPSNGLVLANNSGIDDIAPTVVASAASISATSTASAFSITGTTTITSITSGLWPGRRITLIKTDAGTVTIGGGGNVPGTHTLAQNGSLTLYCNGTNWY